MPQVQSILELVDKLDLKELESLLQKIMDRIDRKRKLEAAFDHYIGLGEGVWDSDAQEYVDQLRSEDDELPAT
jgi:hypothetical protein